MIDIANEIIEQLKTDLLPTEDRWGELTENQYTRLYTARKKVLSLEVLIDSLQGELTASKSLISLMGDV